jgi:non-ribosomal peptide synthase protein (TIGR01720 family)
LLKVDRVGLEDNFFELGGDSIKAIQIISRLYRHGLQTEVKDIFQFATIAELSKRVRQINLAIDQSPVKGIVPLTPIQREFFEFTEIDRNHFNQSAMLYRAGGFDETMIREVFTFLQNHHDALRMKFTQVDEQVLQTNQDIDVELSLTCIDLTSLEEYSEVLSAEATNIQSGMNLETGPLMKLGLFHTRSGDFLLIAIHHLVVDTVSWRILFEDVDTLYNQCLKGEPLGLPPKTESFKKWAEHLVEYSNSDQIVNEKQYWMTIQEGENIKCTSKAKGNFRTTREQVKNISFSLTDEQTKKLLTSVHRAYNTQVNDILLTAVGLSLTKCFDTEKIVISLEGHGRENITRDINISRTIGWFTTIFPVLLDMDCKNDLSGQIKKIKEMLRNMPNNGIGYGLLNYITAEENRLNLPNPSISFNYLGQFDTDITEKSFEIMNHLTGVTESPKRPRKYNLEIVGMVVQYQLRLTIIYSLLQFDEKEIISLADSLKECLETVIRHCVEKTNKELTPSDFDYKELTVEDLNSIFD